MLGLNIQLCFIDYLKSQPVLTSEWAQLELLAIQDSDFIYVQSFGSFGKIGKNIGICIENGQKFSKV